MTLEDLISGCKKNDRKAQNALYARYAKPMFGLCKRYIKDKGEAEEIMINGFYKVFMKIDQFRGQGSFEGWMKRVIINEALMYLRRYNMNLSVELNENSGIEKVLKPDAGIREQDILKLLDYLPIGYRTVFNLYAIEGYQHQEIADKLGISINTSKSQLLKARKKLKELLEQRKYNVA